MTSPWPDDDTPALPAEAGVAALARSAVRITLDAIADRIAVAFDAGCIVFFFSDDRTHAITATVRHASPATSALLGEYSQALQHVEGSKVLPTVKAGAALRRSASTPQELAPQVAELARPLVLRSKTTAFLCVPVVVGGEAIGGVLVTHYLGQAPFTQEDEDALRAEVEAVAEEIARERTIVLLEHELGERERAAGTLAEAVERFRSAFEHASVAMGIVSVGPAKPAAVIAVNEAFHRLFGYTADDLAELDPVTLVHPEDREAALATDRRLLAGEVPSYVLEHRAVRSDGSVVWVQMQSTLARAADGRPLFRTCQFLDVSDRHERDEQLRRLALTVDRHVDTIVGMDRDGNVTSWNSGAERTYGFSRAEMLGRSVLAIVPEELHDETADLLRRALDGETINGFATRRRTRGGVVLDVELTVSAVRDDAGRVESLAAVCRDVTERQRMRAELARSEERYRRIVETAGDGVWVIDRSGVTTFVNDALCGMLGVERDDLLGAPFDAFLPADRVEPARARMARAMEGKTESRFETRLLRADGHELHVLLNERPLHDDAGTFTGMVALITDVDDRVRAEAALRGSEALNRAILEAANDGIVTINARGSVVNFNPAAERLWGWAREDVVGRCAVDTLVAPPDRDATLRVIDAMRADPDGAHDGRYELEALRGDGTTFTAEATVAVAQGDPLLMTGHVRDVTDRRRHDERRSRRIEEHARVAALSRDALGGVPVPQLLVEAVEMARDVLRVDAVELLDSDDRPAQASEGQAHLSVVIPTRRTQRRRVLHAVSGMPRTFGDDERAFLETTANVLAAAIDRADAEAEIAHRSLHDDLTGLPNRMLFADRVDHVLARSQNGASAVAVVVLDLDRLSSVNETLGYEAGDEVLTGVAADLRSALEPGDTLARLGGDSFAVLFARPGDELEAVAVTDRLLGVLGRERAIAGASIAVTASAGVAVAASTADASAEALLRDADIALDRAKEAGGARIELFDAEMRRTLVQRVELERDLRAALDRGELEVAFEPIVSLRDGHAAGVHARPRCHRAEQGVIEGAELAGVADRADLAESLVTTLLDQACRQLARWDREGRVSFAYVVVELLGHQARHPRLDAMVQAALEASGLAPDRLVLEVGEAAVATPDQAPAEALQRLRRLGVRALLDDFGAGTSSLGYLKRFAVDGVKIDHSLVRALTGSAGERHVVEAIVRMARALGLDVVAGGVETAEQARWLRRLGCGVAQGRLFGGPLRAGELEAELAALLEGVKGTDAVGPVDDEVAFERPAPPWVGGEGTTMTLSEAAAALGVSASTVRRMADSGRLPVVRTTGGHRRFARADVEAVVGRRPVTPRLRSRTVPIGELPATAAVVADVGRELALRAGRAMYEPDAPGWFTDGKAAVALDRWALELAAACGDGDEEAAGMAAVRLMASAFGAGAGLPEVDAFLGTFLGLLAHVLERRGAAEREIAETRRLFARLRARALDDATSG